MRIAIPGQDLTIRLFERVETVNGTYDIYDVGVEQEDGTIDSIAVGGSFSYAKSLIKKAEDKKAERKAKEAAAKAPEAEAVPGPGVRYSADDLEEAAAAVA